LRDLVHKIFAFNGKICKFDIGLNLSKKYQSILWNTKKGKSLEVRYFIQKLLK